MPLKRYGIETGPWFISVELEHHNMVSEFMSHSYFFFWKSFVGRFIYRILEEEKCVILLRKDCKKKKERNVREVQDQGKKF